MSTITITVNNDGKLNTKQLFNAFMSTVEPDLMTKNVKKLKKKYANETKAQRVARGERYKEALQKYSQFFDAFLSNLKGTLSKNKRKNIAKAEADERKEEMAELEALEDLIS